MRYTIYRHQGDNIMHIKKAWNLVLHRYHFALFDSCMNNEYREKLYERISYYHIKIVESK